MNLSNCSRCGKVFSQVKGGRDVCPACVREEEDHYRKIFQYLSTRPAATAQEIAQATEIDVKEIYRYVRENRLRLVKADTGLFCESCSIPIAQGRICEKCRQKLSEEIKNDVDKFKHQHASQPPKSGGSNSNPKYLSDRRQKGKNG